MRHSMSNVHSLSDELNGIFVLHSTLYQRQGHQNWSSATQK